MRRRLERVLAVVIVVVAAVALFGPPLTAGGQNLPPGFTIPSIPPRPTFTTPTFTIPPPPTMPPESTTSTGPPPTMPPETTTSTPGPPPTMPPTTLDLDVPTADELFEEILEEFQEILDEALRRFFDDGLS